MRLKSLSLSGFKSFADRTVLEFHPGMTAIVGPNGCGKSNVVDAIRWVLGESSAKALRGGEMADVIFNGTDKRKPVGSAEVTLTLTECEQGLHVEFHEVAISRRVFRDGHSEFRINNNLCRRKDIQDLLSGTGIGQTAYSVMEQGKIDLLLSSKPEDRRAVFEEAAGITRFKQQKREALRKLEYTEANLLRHEDLIAELTRQRNSLQRQAVKAQRYQELLEDVQTLDLHVAHRRQELLRAQKDELLTSIRALTSEEEGIRALQEGVRKGLLEKEAILGGLESEYHALLQKKLDLQDTRTSCTERLSHHAERRAELEARIRDTSQEMDKTRSLLDEQRHALEDAERALLDLQRRREQLSGELHAAEQQHREAGRERFSAQQAAAKLRDERQEILTAIAGLEAAGQSRRQQAELDRRREEQLAADTEALGKEQVVQARNQENLRRNLDQSDAAERELEARLKEQTLRVSRSQEELRGLESAWREAERALALTVSRIEMLRRWVEQGEGLETGTRCLLQGLDEPETFRGAVRGVLGSMIHVADPRFLRAIETALGPFLQTVVLAGDADLADSALERMRERRLGFASVLTDQAGMAPGPFTAALPPGVLARASEVLCAAPIIQPVIDRLLGNVFIVDSLAAARRTQPQCPRSLLVTLSGEMLLPEGIVQGGALAESPASVLRLQNELDSLETRLTGHQAHADAAGERLKAGEESLRDFVAAKEELAASLQDCRLARSRMRDEQVLSEKEWNRISQRLAALELERCALHQKQAEWTTEDRAAAARLTERKHSLHRIDAAIPRQDAALSQLSEQEIEAGRTVAALRTQVAVEQQAEEALLRHQTPLTGRLRELDELQLRRSTEIDNCRQRIQQLEANSEELNGQLVQAESGLAEIGETLAGFSAHRQNLNREIASLQGEIDAHAARRSAVQEQRGKEEVECAKLDLRLDHLAQTMQERYRVDLFTFESDPHRLLATLTGLTPTGRRSRSEDEAAAAGLDVPGEPDWEQVESLALDMRRRLDAMGPVNLEAIEEFQELEERLTFNTEQRNDLLRAKEELHRVLLKINRESRARFVETFAKVRENFRIMFRELFGNEGTSDLLLIDDDDPLESGIEIIAKPPGKKTQSITLLSGGERSMTAVALLFAIYMVKPSPFCVLDELDAPLDEANIARFLRVLDRFVQESQFVVITHNKRTMTRADVMYGVTMEEFGVSKPVGMKLTGPAETASISS
ncbi:MAG TPA: chromosome segregation protein SMC [Verrucomicrobiales bacterium]|nr:chromosome segregation protein SMC [Verrucomicrobiales bacterium]